MTSRKEDNKMKKTRREHMCGGGGGGGGGHVEIRQDKTMQRRERQRTQEDRGKKTKCRHLHKTRDKYKPPRQDNIPRVHIKADKTRQLDNTTTEEKLKWMEEKCVNNVDKSSSNVIL